METHYRSNPWTYLQVKRSKVKVNKPINVVTDNTPGLWHYNFLTIIWLVHRLIDLLTEVDDGDSGGPLSDDKCVDDGLDEVENQLPVVGCSALVEANARRVVDHERDVGNANCNQLKTE